MFAQLASLLLAFSVSGTVRAGAHALIDHLADDANVRTSDEVRVAAGQRADDDEDVSDDDGDTDADLEVVPPRPPPPPGKPALRIQIGDENAGDSNGDLPQFSETARNVPAVEVLHRIARTAGWSLTIVGVAKERIDVHVTDADPREAVRQVLTASRSMGVLRRSKLVVVPAPEARMVGTLVEHVSRRERRARGMRNGHGQDMVHAFHLSALPEAPCRSQSRSWIA